VSSQIDALVALPPAKKLCTYSLGGRVSPRASMDVSGEEKIPFPYWYSNRGYYGQ